MKNEELGYYVNEDIESIKDYLTEGNGEQEWLEAIQNAKAEQDIVSLYSDLEDYLYNADAITGNGSGSFYFNSLKAKDTVLSHIEEVVEAYRELGLDIGTDLEKGDWEGMDVTARCFYLYEAVGNFVTEYKQELEEA